MHEFRKDTTVVAEITLQQAGGQAALWFDRTSLIPIGRASYRTYHRTGTQDTKYPSTTSQTCRDGATTSETVSATFMCSASLFPIRDCIVDPKRLCVCQRMYLNRFISFQTLFLILAKNTTFHLQNCMEHRQLNSIAHLYKRSQLVAHMAYRSISQASMLLIHAKLSDALSVANSGWSMQLGSWNTMRWNDWKGS